MARKTTAAALAVILTLALSAAAMAGAREDIARGNAAAQAKDYPRAIGLYTQAIDSGRLSPANLAVAYMNRGSAQDDRGRTKQAVADFTKAIQADPKLDLAYYNRSFAYEKQKKLALAVADMEKAVRLSSDDRDYLDRLRYLNEKLAGNPVIGEARP